MVRLDILKIRSQRGVSVACQLFRNFELVQASDVISLIAPRSFIAVSGDKDHIFPYKGAASVVEEAATFFERFNAASKISAHELAEGTGIMGSFRGNILYRIFDLYFFTCTYPSMSRFNNMSPVNIR